MTKVFDLSRPLPDDAFSSVKHFARWMIKDNRLLLAPVRDEVWNASWHGSIADQKIMTSILFRSGCWQVELLCFGENVSTPTHRHNFCESAEVMLNGDIEGCTNGQPFPKPRGSNLAANIVPLPRGSWHGGETKRGLIMLSFQKWMGMKPTFIANDWELYDHTR